MKPRRSFISNVVLILAFACAISISAVAQGPPGRLIVERAPNFGWNLAFHLDINGRSVGTIVQGRSYSTWLPAGPHVLTVYKVPRVGYAQPTSTTVNIHPGADHLYVAMWDSGLVYLHPAQVPLTPGAYWQLHGDGAP